MKKEETQMTHTTEQDRATFEAWYIKSAKNAVPAFSAWSDIEVRDGCMRPDEESYKIDTARISWEAWQAARRAPAAPVPQSEPVAYLWQHCETGRTRVVMPDMVITADANWIVAGPLYLAAAPQPPEADMGNPISASAPVQLPEPVAFALEWTFNGEERGMRLYDDETHCRFDAESDGGVCHPLYTEQQVRALLEAKASVSNGTLSDVCQRENIREGAPYDKPEFEQLARDLGVWGTAQAALCAQFWMAAKEQST